MEQEGTPPASPSSEGTPNPHQELHEGERIPDVAQESPAPAREDARGQSGEQEGVSNPEGPPGGSLEEQPLQEEGSSLGAPQSVPGAGAEPPRAQPPGREADFYCVKWISWKGERTPVVTQSENGPCPLLAIINVLLLQWKARRGLLGRGIPGDSQMARGGMVASVLRLLPGEAAPAEGGDHGRGADGTFG